MGQHRRMPGPTLPVPTHHGGTAGEFTDPLWRVRVVLTPLEAELLRCAPVRRLHGVGHAGASALTTLQPYSRLEHSLGVLALVAHFRPDDPVLRAAALLHDVGHLPLSHTLEGLAPGLDHHALGLTLLHTAPVAQVLARHGTEPAAVAALLDGGTRSPLHLGSGQLSLDHLDSFVRSGRCAARLEADPPRLLAALTLTGDAVDATPDAAGHLVGLVRAEAELHTSWDNTAPTAVVQRLVRRLLAAGGVRPAELARLTDRQFWTLLESHPFTRAETLRLLAEPHRLAVVPTAGEETTTSPADGWWPFALRKIYRSAPLVQGRPLAEVLPELVAELDGLAALPREFRVRWA